MTRDDINNDMNLWMREEISSWMKSNHGENDRYFQSVMAQMPDSIRVELQARIIEGMMSVIGVDYFRMIVVESVIGMQGGKGTS